MSDPFEVVRTVEVELKSIDSLCFRIDVLRNRRRKDLYRVRVQRQDTYKLPPAFAPRGFKVAWERIWVEDSFFGRDRVRAKSVEEVLDKVLTSIRDHFMFDHKTKRSKKGARTGT